MCVGAQPDPESLLRTVSCSGELAWRLGKGQPVALEERGARHGKEGRGPLSGTVDVPEGGPLAAARAPTPAMGAAKASPAQSSALAGEAKGTEMWDGVPQGLGSEGAHPPTADGSSLLPCA